MMQPMYIESEEDYENARAPSVLILSSPSSYSHAAYARVMNMTRMKKWYLCLCATSIIIFVAFMANSQSALSSTMTNLEEHSKQPKPPSSATPAPAQMPSTSETATEVGSNGDEKGEDGSNSNSIPPDTKPVIPADDGTKTDDSGKDSGGTSDGSTAAGGEDSKPNEVKSVSTSYPTPKPHHSPHHTHDEAPTSAPQPAPTPRQPVPTPDLSPVEHKSRRKDNSGMTQKEQKFVDEYCDLTGSATWYPQETDQWQLNAPYVILLLDDGSASKAIASHNRFKPTASNPQLNGLLLNVFSRFSSKAKTRINSARNKMYASGYKKSLLLQTDEDEAAKKAPLLAMDASSDYLFFSSTPSRLLCVTPWARMVAVLSPPIQRVVDEWQFFTTNYHLKQNLTDWIAPELDLMTQVGLIRDKDGSDGTSEAVDQASAWASYQQQAAQKNMPCAIGKSLYALQLKPWFDAYQESDKAIPDNWLIVGSRDDSAATRLQSFLELSTPITMPPTAAASSALSSVDADTKKTLAAFFAPHNRQLDKLLASVGMPAVASTWDGVR